MPALNEVAGGAVRQVAEQGCVAACGEMLTNGAVSQEQLLAQIGENSNAEALGRALGPEWRGGGLGAGPTPDEAFQALTETGPWGATMRGVTQDHMVVVDGLHDAGHVMVRDPFQGTSYETPYSEFMGAWRGQAVFKP